METPLTLNSLFFAYTVIWFLIAAYLFFINRKISKLETRINRELDNNSELPN